MDWLGTNFWSVAHDNRAKIERSIRMAYIYYEPTSLQERIAIVKTLDYSRQ